MRVLVILCVARATITAAAADPEKPNHVFVDVAEEVGVLSTTHSTITVGYARRLWGDRAYVEARAGAGTNFALLVIEERVGIGLVFRPSERVDLRVGTRIGHSHFRGTLGDASYSTHLLAIELAVQFGIALQPYWHLRAAPVVPTLFWNRTYGGSLGIELGVGHAF